MFRIDRHGNRIHKLESTTFAAERIKEREHLQEWLAASPEALGDALDDDLLIIQKEFDGFDGTRERLDLLALDRNGQIVVIENKLDDSGRDVTWQAIKYAAYCSSLKKAEIVGIFQQYLDRQGGGDAAAAICEFLEVGTLDEFVLNEGNDQRIVFIAANFRREVTATVLWLREHQIDARCVKVIPYKYGEELLIDLQQVIPTPEAADYMIRMVQKDAEEKTAKGAQERRHVVRQEFWKAVSARFAIRPVGLFPSPNITTDNWITSSSIDGCHYSIVFTQNSIAVKLNLTRFEADENKWLFDRLYQDKDKIEELFGVPLNWRRMDEKKASRIEAEYQCDGFNSDVWPEIIEWAADASDRLEEAIHEKFLGAIRNLKTEAAQR
ncbi:MAG: hypothetical protein C0606_06455 [Hyphomicrobiales bacterium]|nr:MAG: hypothetical protein C0606_06455 [Hyphomicrobiales bacterium]